MDKNQITETKKVTCKASDLCFMENLQAECSFLAVEGSEEKVPKLRMTALSGDLIRNHFYWGNLAINIDGVELAQAKTPILRDHDTNRPIAFSESIGKSIREDGKPQFSVLPDKTTFVDTDHAKDFIKLSGQGFPFQSSIYAIPSSVTRYKTPTDIELNGRKFEKVDTVWNKCKLKEVSVCIFGHDSKTQAQTAFVEGEVEVEVSTIGPTKLSQSWKEVYSMDKLTLEQFKSDFKEVAEEYAAEIVAEEKKKTQSIEERFQEVTNGLKDLGAKLATVETENGKLKTENTELQTTVKQFSKEKEAAVVDKVWAEKLSASSIPENIRSKVKLAIVEESFRKDGRIDIEALTVAIEKEIKEWEEAGITTSDALGFGSRGSNPAGDEAAADATTTKKAVDTLSSFLDPQTLKKQA